MSEKKKRRQQFGLWDSPFSSQRLAGGVSLGSPLWDTNGALGWVEWRPGRSALVIQPPDGQSAYDLNAVLSTRGGVGYGGGEFTLHGGQAFFIESQSGRLYAQPLAGDGARPLTPGFGGIAAPAISPDGRYIVFVHSYEGRDVLAITDSAGKVWPQILVQGEDFYMQPTWHPGGNQLAWIAWNHPNMPWDGTFLRLAKLVQRKGTLPVLEEVHALAGGDETAIFQPEFSPDGHYLAYISDLSGWGQIYLYDLHSGETRQLTHVKAEHGTPAWIQGLGTYTFDPRQPRLYFQRNQNGFSSLWMLELETGQETRLPVDEGYPYLEGVSVGYLPGDSAVHLAMAASGPARPKRLLDYRLPAGETRGVIRIIRRTSSEELPEAIFSQPQAIAWSGMDSGTVHGLYYPPCNPAYEGVGKPPLVVMVHGGPTGQTRPAYNPGLQFFTSRGYAVLDVNHRGSTGYGRNYMAALRGQWGVYDVQDSVAGARHLAEIGWIDGSRMVIMGGSAGGYTVLQALVDFPGTFKAGICLYGISNQFTAAVETHKFEERYSDQLLGPLPEAAEIYRQRSPLFHTERIQDAVALFQGEDDQVVRRNQSDEIVEVLRRRGVPHIYHVYPGEGHGFRKPETIQHFYTATEGFLRQYVLYA